MTTGGSTVQAIEAVRDAGYEVCGVVSILDRLAGGAEAIAEASGGAPYAALATIDDVYPDRPGPGVGGSAAERQRRLGRGGVRPGSAGPSCSAGRLATPNQDTRRRGGSNPLPYPAQLTFRHPVAS